MNESGTGSSHLSSIAEVLESTPENVVTQMFTCTDGFTWRRREERRTISLSIITQKNTLKQKLTDIIYQYLNIYTQ